MSEIPTLVYLEICMAFSMILKKHLKAQLSALTFVDVNLFLRLVAKGIVLLFKSHLSYNCVIFKVPISTININAAFGFQFQSLEFTVFTEVCR